MCSRNLGMDHAVTRSAGDAVVTRTTYSLPTELLIKIFDRLAPDGPISTFESRGKDQQMCSSYLESRYTLASICRTSRLLNRIATRYLYQTVLIKSQRESFRFFRSLASNPNLRPLVRSFIWAAVLRHDETVEAKPRDPAEDLDSIVSSHWEAMNWPRDADDALIAWLVELEDSSNWSSEKFLAATLAMTTHLKSLFLALGSGPRCVRLPDFKNYPYSVSSEYLPLRKLLCSRLYQQYKSSGQKDMYNRQRPPPRIPEPNWNYDELLPDKYLQELEVLVLEPYEHSLDHIITPGAMIQILSLNSRSLRRFDLKDINPMGKCFMPSHPGKQGPAIMQQSPSIQKIQIFGGSVPQFLIPKVCWAFPKLSTLRIEFDTVTANTTRFSYIFDPVIQGIGTLKDSLETLSLTTASRASWRAPGSRPILTSTLKQMRVLKCLVVEFIWLFGMWPDSPQLDISDCLPTSLTTLQLSEYWGFNGMHNYYPSFPTCQTPLQFLHNILADLHRGCQHSLPNLRDIVIIPAGGFSANHLAMFGKDTIDDYKSMYSSFIPLFASIGVRFSVATFEDWSSQTRSNWSNVGRLGASPFGGSFTMSLGRRRFDKDLI
jgi:hypothetical protein